jgi:toxin CptA
VVLWQCDLRVSWRSQLSSLGIHGAVMLLILLAPWPDNCWGIWLGLLVLVVFECIRSQRRISLRHGEIRLLDGGLLQWRQHQWQIKQPVWMLSYGMLLVLRRATHTPHRWPCRRYRCQKLWLASDSMSKEEWRKLRSLLLAYQAAHRQDRQHKPLH